MQCDRHITVCGAIKTKQARVSPGEECAVAVSKISAEGGGQMERLEAGLSMRAQRL